MSLVLLLCLVGCTPPGSERDVTATPPAASTHALTTQAADGQGTIALVNVNLVPMDSERILAGQTVVVRDGRIVWLGPASEAPLPEGSEVIEGQGAYLLPGLADLHVHISSQEEFLLYVANGITVLRDMNGSARHLSWRQAIADGELLAPQLYAASPTIDGSPSVYGGGMLSVATAAEARGVVREQAQAGYDFIKVYSRLSPEVYDAIIAEAGAYGLPVVGHVPVDVGLEHALAAGQASLEHLLGYVDALEADDSPLRGQWTYRRLYGAIEIDETRIAPVAQATRAAGVWNCPTLVAMDRWLPPDEAQTLLAQPHLRYLPPSVYARWNRMKGSVSAWLADSDPALRQQGRLVRQRIVRGLRDAGARLLLGTDAGSIYVEPGFSIQVELQNLVEAGLTPYEAIRAGTHDAAEFLGASDEFGTLAVGKRADLLLVEGNPLTDVAHLQCRVGVMLRGQWLPEARLQQLLEEQAARQG